VPAFGLVFGRQKINLKVQMSSSGLCVDFLHAKKIFQSKLLLYKCLKVFCMQKDAHDLDVERFNFLKSVGSEMLHT
jgi:hypothetical protein